MTLNRRVVFQVTMPALLIALTLLGTSLLGIRSLGNLEKNRDLVVTKNTRSLQAALELEIQLRQLRFHSLLYVMDTTEKRWRAVEQDEKEFEAALYMARESASSADEERLIEQIKDGFSRYHAELQSSADTFPGLGPAEYTRWADAHPVRHLVKPCEELLELSRKSMDSTAKDSADESQRTRSTMVLLAVLGTAGGLIGGYGVARALSRSITRLSVRLQDVSAHLDREVASIRLTAEGGDLQTMDRQVGRILERVREVVGQLHRQERESLRAEQLSAVGHLAASIAHEVRNPLTSIKLLVGAALKGRPARPLTEADLRVIHDEVGRLEGKVQALLDFARPRETERRPNDAVAIVRQAAELVSARSRQQNVSLNLDLPESPVVTELDRDQFQGVLVNLFLNALDAMQGGGALDVSLRRGAGGALEVSVADTGPGIDPAMAGRLFTPFVSTKSTGTGLGLSVSRRIVQSHGGTLDVENRPGGGACFTITIPPTTGGAADADAARGR